MDFISNKNGIFVYIYELHASGRGQSDKVLKSCALHAAINLSFL